MLLGRLFNKKIVKMGSLLKQNYFSFGKIVSINLPDLGEGTKEAIVRTWFKKEGDLVEEEEKVVEVYTDKLVAELPSPGKGKISKINYKQEQACLVGKSLCEIEIEEEGGIVKKSEDKIVKEESLVDLGIQDILKAEEQMIKAEEGIRRPGKIIASPAVRFALKQYNLDPVLVTATGTGGRIMKEDVLNHVYTLQHDLTSDSCQQRQESHHVNHHKKSNHKSHKHEEKALPAEATIQASFETSQAATGEDKIVKLVGFQKAMTKTMTQSTHIPSFLYTDEFNVDKLVKLRKEMNKIEAGNNKFTFMPFFIKAVSFALKEFPHLNSLVNPKLAEDGYIFEYTVKRDHNISIAIDSSEGLVVPNIKKVQDKSIIQIQKELYELRAKVESKKLTKEDLKDGSFTISNIGNIGGKVLSPIILPPQVCIIGISKIFDSIAVVPKANDTEDAIVHELVSTKDQVVLFRKSLNLCISADHRIIDGATVARFSELLKFYIENPVKIILGN